MIGDSNALILHIDGSTRSNLSKYQRVIWFVS